MISRSESQLIAREARNQLAKAARRKGATPTERPTKRRTSAERERTAQK